MGGKRTKRIRRATGIYEDAYGFGVIVRGKEHRYPLGTPLTTLRKDRRELLDDVGAVVARKGTLEADVATYLATLPEDITEGVDRRRRKSDAAMLLRHWLDATTEINGRTVGLATMPRDAITAVHIQTQISAWRSAGKAEATCDMRRRELGSLYTALNGKAGYNPVRAVPKFAPTYDDPRGFDMNVLRTIIDSMPDRGSPRKGDSKAAGTFPTVNEAKVRLRVILECAIPPQTLKRVSAADIDLKAKTLNTQRRRKGRGAKGRQLPLTRRAVAALRAFMEAGLYGWYDQRAANRSFKSAVKRYQDAWVKEHPTLSCPVPADLHATDLRHAYLSDLYRRSRNLKAVGYSAGHAPNSPLTNRYVQAAVYDVAKAAVEMVDQASTRLPRAGKKSAKTPTIRDANAPARTRQRSGGKTKKARVLRGN